MLKAFNLLTLCSLLCLQVFSQNTAEKLLNKNADDFMNTHRSSWNELSKRMDSLPDESTTERMDLFRHHHFFKDYKSFVEKNGSNYARARAINFGQYAAPPAALTQLNWITPSGETADGINNILDMLSVAFIRSFEPNVPAQLIYSMTLPEMISASYTTMEEVANNDHLKGLYGNLIYTKRDTGSIWQVWSATRAYAIQFSFNTRNGIVSNIQHTVPRDPAYAAIQWPPAVIKPADNAAHLAGALMQQLWNTYPGKDYDPDRYNEFQEKRNVVMLHFNQQHHAEFIKAREQNLKALQRSFTGPEGYKELTDSASRVVDNDQVIFEAATYIYPVQWNTYISTAANVYFQLDMKDISKRLEQNGLFASNIYTHQLGNNEWEVWTVNAADAMYYIWNIDTGAITKVRYWIK